MNFEKIYIYKVSQKFQLKFKFKFQYNILLKKMLEHETFPENLQNFHYFGEKNNLFSFESLVKALHVTLSTLNCKNIVFRFNP